MLEKTYIAIEDEQGLLVDINGQHQNILIFQTNKNVYNFWHTIDYVPYVTETFTKIYKEQYPNINLQFYETKRGSLLEFWKDKPKVFSVWQIHRLIKCNNTLLI